MKDPYLRAYEDWIERVDYACRRRRLPGVLGGATACGATREDDTPPAWVVDELCRVTGLQRPEPREYTYGEVRSA